MIWRCCVEHVRHGPTYLDSDRRLSASIALDSSRLACQTWYSAREEQLGVTQDEFAPLGENRATIDSKAARSSGLDM